MSSADSPHTVWRSPSHAAASPEAAHSPRRSPSAASPRTAARAAPRTPRSSLTGVASPLPSPLLERSQLSSVSPSPSLPEVLEFTSWWREGSSTHTMRLQFVPETREFVVRLADSVRPLSVAIVRRSGEPFDIWDLHVGAVLDVLGKSTTLRSASNATVEWIEAEAKRLTRMRERLSEEVAKFTFFKLPTLRPHGQQCTATGMSGSRGSCCLRVLLEDVLELRRVRRRYLADRA